MTKGGRELGRKGGKEVKREGGRDNVISDVLQVCSDASVQ